MSSEAAQKAYPKDERIRDVLTQWSIARQQEAFDRGAVEALRQAADLVWVKSPQGPESEDAVERIRQLADEWVVGQ